MFPDHKPELVCDKYIKANLFCRSAKGNLDAHAKEIPLGGILYRLTSTWLQKMMFFILAIIAINIICDADRSMLFKALLG